MFRGARSSIEMLKGKTDGESLGTPALQRTVFIVRSTANWFSWILNQDLATTVAFYQLYFLLFNEKLSQAFSS